MHRLDIGQSNIGVLPGAHRVNGNIECAVRVLLGDGGLPAGLFLLFINFTRPLLFQNLAGNGLAIDQEGKLAYGCVFRNGEGIDGLQVFAVGVAEHLFDSGDGVTVLDHHVDMVFKNFQRLMPGPCGYHQAGGVGGAGPQHGEKQQCQAGEKSIEGFHETSSIGGLKGYSWGEYSACRTMFRGSLFIYNL